MNFWGKTHHIVRAALKAQAEGSTNDSALGRLAAALAPRRWVNYFAGQEPQGRTVSSPEVAVQLNALQDQMNRLKQDQAAAAEAAERARVEISNMLKDREIA